MITGETSKAFQAQRRKAQGRNQQSSFGRNKVEYFWAQGRKIF
jgi:hypothetical protein